MKELIEFFSDKSASSILDVGTGTGDFIPVIQKTFPSAKITGIDPNSESLAIAKEKYPEVAFHAMTGEELKFKNQYFDVATISMALHHLPSVQATLKEMQRVVKSGGWIIVNELFSDNLNAAQEVHKMMHHFRSQIHRLTGENHFETFKKEEILQKVNEAGIKIQFHFEFDSPANLITEPAEIEERIQKMVEALETIQGKPEYEILKPQINQFREQATIHGFQPATKLVVVGQVK